MTVPHRPISLMSRIYKKVLPFVHEELREWKRKAGNIPDPELKKQALSSLESKTFHCEGGAIYSLLAGDRQRDVIKFIVAYQTISDYLDNLCDRSVSLDPADFEQLHLAMGHALTPSEACVNYYSCRENQEDGGYLTNLVQTCQDFLRSFNNLEQIQPALHELAGYYCDLQIHKHVIDEERVPRLKEWFLKHQASLPQMSWYEFSACSGSTLGIFCIVSYACRLEDMSEWVTVIKKGYFPWVQGLHIMMDYFIDQEEDRKGGDLNFCFYYENEKTLLDRLYHFIDQADQSINKLPDHRFHMMINKGLLGIYLADRKVAKQKDVRLLSRHILKKSGGTGFFFFINGWLYRRLKPGG